MKFTTLAAAIAFALPALAANCNPEGSSGSVSTYQQVAAGVCNGSSCGSSSNPCRIGNIYGWYTGNAKIHCWDAFNNIIAQCVQGSGRGGGSWDWNSNGVDEHYALQSR